MKPASLAELLARLEEFESSAPNPGAREVAAMA
jgi:hypothetical protein